MASKTVLYYITFKCNDTCEFCSFWDDKELQSITEAPLEKHLENLKEARLKGGDLLEVTGGEPLLCEGLPRFLAKAKELGFKTRLLTNGILYSEKAAELKGLTEKICFSLDYPVQEDHDRCRGLSCFNASIGSIRKAKMLGENASIYFTITRDSVRFLPEMIELSHNMKVPVEVHPVYDFQGLHGFEKRTYDHIRYYMKRPNVLMNLAELEFLRNRGNNTVFPRCRANESTMTYLPDGNKTSPCIFNRGGRQGRENACSGCTRWPYMLPSFKIGFDKYSILDRYSDWINGRKSA